MDLTEDQRNAVRKLVLDGAGLAEVQKLLADEFGIKMTYLDVRFLVMDMNLDVRDKRIEAPAASQVDGEEPMGGLHDGLGRDGAHAGGGVSVEVDRVVKGGSLVSGTARMSDGTRLTWFVDQMGRLGLDAGKPDYRPSPEDLQSFQNALREELEKRGF